MIRYYPVTPMAKPRMTRMDAGIMSKLRGGRRLNAKEQKRGPLLSRWLAYSDEVRLRRVYVPEGSAHLCFVLPFPSSWSEKKRCLLRGYPHRGKKDGARKNDVDNLAKGLLDICFGDDSAVWDIRLSKIWSDHGGIFVCDNFTDWPFVMPLDVRGWRAVATRGAQRSA